MFGRTYYPSTAGSVVVPASAGVYGGYGGVPYAGSYGGSYYGGYQQAPIILPGRSSSRSSVVVSQPMGMGYPAVPHTAMPYGYGGYPAAPGYYGGGAPTVIMTNGSSSSRRSRRHSHSYHRSHSRSRFWDF